MKSLKQLVLLAIFGICAGVGASAQTLINVKLAGDNPGAPTGAAVVGSAGNTWNYFPNLTGRASGGGVVTNAATIKDSTGTTLAGAAMSMSLSGGDGLDPWTDNTSFSPVPSLIMGTYVFEVTGTYYFTFNFTGLQPNKTYLLYGMGCGNASGQGTTWWVDAANGHATASASANFVAGDRNATLASNQGICWAKVQATTTASGALTFRVVRLGAAENGTGGSGRSYLNAFQLQSLSAPITTSLTNRTVVAGTSIILNPVTAGTPTPFFQWRSNLVNIVGETNSSLSLPNVQYGQNGFTYSLVASNLVGATTNSMVLTVIVAPTISGLTNQAAAVGTDVTISSTVSGVPTPTLQWQKNSTNIVGATTASYFVANAQAFDSGTYSLIASNSAGLATNSMILTVSSSNVAPSITGPADQIVVQTSNAIFTASMSGLPLPTLQWRMNGVDLLGQTLGSLTVSNVQYAQNGFVYSLVASNAAGLATNSASLYVLVPPVISQQPTNLAVSVGSPTTFSVAAGGVPAVKYQWSRNGSPITNATNATYTLASALGADNGAIFSVTVSNSVGVATSSNATLTVLSTMTGTFLPTNGAVNISPDQQLRITFSGGTPKLAYTGKKMYVYDAANNSLFTTIDTSQFQTYTVDGATVSNAFVRVNQGSYFYYMPIALYGNQAWITFTNHFIYGHTYYVNCDTGLFLDSAGASFPAITNTTAWRFSIKASGPATPTASTGPAGITVGLDGAGDFATLQGASDWVPQNNTLHRTITIQPGIYHDNTCFLQSRRFVTVTGATTNRNDVQLICPSAGYAPPSSGNGATLIVGSNDDDFRNFTLDNQVYLANSDANNLNNYSGAFAGRLLVLITTSDRLVFDNMCVKGGQDTYYASGSGYFHNCEIWGSVDFIYGPAVLVFEQCNIVEIRNSGGPITAPNTPYAQPYGMVFLNCTFPRALVANGYPYDVGTANTTFQRAWGQDGMTAIINCAVGGQIFTAGWGTFGSGSETTCRAREYGTTLIGGGTAPTIAQRQAAGAYWLNTIDPDYTSSAMSPTDALLAPPAGTNNRVAVTVNSSDYTVSAVFGNSYFANLAGWTWATIPIISQSPTNQTVNADGTAAFSVIASGLPSVSCQWQKNGTNIPGATNATLVLAGAKLADNGSYSVTVSNSAGSVTSSNAVLTVPAQSTSIMPAVTNGMLNLSWPVSQTGYRLLAQTNPPGSGLTTNWQTVSGSNVTNQVMIPINQTSGSVFYRLAYP